MNQKEAIEKAKQMNKNGFEFLLGGKIRFVAQDIDGSWRGFREAPFRAKNDDSWDSDHGYVYLDRQWNDDWENTLAEVK